VAWLVLLVENLFFPLGALVIVLRFLLSSRRKVLLSLKDELRERLGGVGAEPLQKLRGRPVLWVHAASAGEVAAVSGLLERIKAGPTPPAVILTCTTVAGREKAASLPFADTAVLAPLDCYPAVSRFLGSVKPYALILVETELWPQTIALAAGRGVRIGLVNGRMTERSFGRYRWLVAGVRPFLAQISRLALQTPEDARRFEKVGAAAGTVRVVGNMKYDRLKPSAKDPKVAERLAALGWDNAAIFVAGSTHSLEEDVLIAGFLSLRNRFPHLKLILAPRHPERADQAGITLSNAGIGFRSWSQEPGPADCLLIDGLGVLPKLYPFAAVSFVGGSLVPVGGHNLLEPAIAGTPVLFGPHTGHTREVAALLQSAGVGFCIEDAKTLASVASDLLGDDQRRQALGRQARKTAESLQGAVERTFDHLVPILSVPTL
jgi:3-deoxy-D-manno-octulosonic-acid transferase